MAAAREKAGLPKAVCYGLRHSYATHALAAGLPDATVAGLLGHSGTAMLHRHSSHLTGQARVMRDAAALVHRPPSPTPNAQQGGGGGGSPPTASR